MEEQDDGKGVAADVEDGGQKTEIEATEVFGETDEVFGVVVMGVVVGE